MKKYIFIVEVEAPDDIEWSAKVWEGSLNVAYESSGKFKVTAQQSVHPTNGGLCAICGRPEYSHSPNGHDFRPAISG